MHRYLLSWRSLLKLFVAIRVGPLDLQSRQLKNNCLTQAWRRYINLDLPFGILQWTAIDVLGKHLHQEIMAASRTCLPLFPGTICHNKFITASRGRSGTRVKPKGGVIGPFRSIKGSRTAGKMKCHQIIQKNSKDL